MKLKLWQATVAGGLFGLLLGYGIEILRRFASIISFNASLKSLKAGEIIRRCSQIFLRPEAIPFLSSPVCTAISSLVFVIWSRRI